MSMVHLAAARRIHVDLPVVDGHNDLPWEIRSRAGGSLDAADPTGRLDGYQTDFPRMLEGGVGVQFWSVYVPTWSPAPLADTHRQVDLVQEMTVRGEEFTALAGSADEADRIRAGGRIAGFMGVEGGHQIEGSLQALADLHERGVRYLTLTHADTHDWADSATDVPRHGGLSEFGEQVVREMNRVGMIVDISHVSPDTMRRAVAVSRAPVIASHSSAYALAPHLRNVPDDVLRMVADTGGVVMVAFVPSFVVEATARLSLDMFERERRRRERFAPDDEQGYRAARKAEVESLEIDRGTPADVVDHIEYIAAIAGVDHVGLGSDFDGADLMPEGLDDASCYPAITAELLARGWSEPNVLKVLGGNAMRVLRAVEEAAGG